MSIEKLELYTVVSSGKIAEGFNHQQVNKNIQSRFSLNEQQADNIVSKGTILKNNLGVSGAQKLCRNFLKLGLIAGYRPVSQQATKKPAAIKKKVATAVKTTVTQKQSKSYDKSDFEKIFNADIPRVPVKFAYKIGLISVACLSLLAPIIYVGLILSLIFGLYFYLAALPELLGSVSSVVLKILAAVIPPFVGVVLILFMSKPFFARRQRWRGFELKPKQAPGLFALVEVMCERMNVPVPKSIYVDNEVNAAAGSAHGLLSLIKGDLVLIVGLPLVSGMTARQLVGILAHEFGHFAQPSAMFTSSLINTVNHWFADRAFYQDSWDERLEDWGARSENFDWAYLAVMLAKLGIGVTRIVFKALYTINLSITSFMSRQMEYDADRYEALVGGSDCFRETSIRLRVLSEAENVVAYDSLLAWNQNKLVKNIPLAIAEQSSQFDKEVIQDIESGMEQSNSNWWDSHPPDNDRVIHAQQYKYDAIFKLDFPAVLLFKNFNELSDNVTLYNHRANGFENPEKYIVENHDVVNLKEIHNKNNKVLDSYFNNSFGSYRMMLLKMPSNLKLQALGLQQTIDLLRRNLVTYRDNQELYFKIDDRYQVMILAASFINANIEIDPEEFYLNNDSVQDIDSAKTKELNQLHKIRAQQEQVDVLFYQRMILAIKKMPVELQKRCSILLKVLQKISQLNETMRNLSYVIYVMEGLLRYEQEDDEKIETIVPMIKQQAKDCVNDVGLLLRASEKIADLIDASDNKNLNQFIVNYTGALPNDLSTLTPYQLVAISHNLINAVQYQYVWLIGELVTLCETQEKSLGIKPIKLVLMAKNN